MLLVRGLFWIVEEVWNFWKVYIDYAEQTSGISRVKQFHEWECCFSKTIKYFPIFWYIFVDFCPLSVLFGPFLKKSYHSFPRLCSTMRLYQSYSVTLSCSTLTLILSFKGLKIFFFVMATIYLAYLLFLLIQAFRELRNVPYFGKICVTISILSCEECV